MKHWPITLCLALASATADAQSTVTFAVTGDPAPGGDGFFFGGGSRSLNNSGEVGFGTFVTDNPGGTTDDVRFYRGNASGMVEIVREGQAAPGGNGSFSQFGPLPAGHRHNCHFAALNDAGQLLFAAVLAGTTGGEDDDYGFFLGDGNALVEIVREAQLAPDGDGVFHGIPFIGRPALNHQGQVGLIASVRGTSVGAADYVGVFRADGSRLVQIARTGQAILGGTLENVFSHSIRTQSRSGVLSINELGQLSFPGSISGGANAGFHVLRGDGTALISILGPGMAAPDGNGSIVSVEGISLNDRDQLSFSAMLSGTAGGSTDDWAIYRRDDATLVKIVREGDLTPSGNGIFAQPLRLQRHFDEINAAGQIVFQANLAGTSEGATDDVGIFIGDGESLVEVMREGQTVPDGDGTFARSFDPPYFEKINTSGQVAFGARIEGGSEGLNSDRGIFFFDPSRGLLQVARVGDPLLGSAIRHLAFEYPNSVTLDVDTKMGFNDLGQVTYRFVLTDGRSGLAIWSSTATEAPPKVTEVSRVGSDLMVQFEASPGLVDWMIFGSTDLQAFPEDLSAQSTITEPASGNYRAFISVPGSPPDYFVRIKR